VRLNEEQFKKKNCADGSISRKRVWEGVWGVRDVGVGSERCGCGMRVWDEGVR